MQPNQFIHRDDGTTVVFLVGKDGAVMEAIIDTADFSLVGRYHWYAAHRENTTYVMAEFRENGKRKHVYLHRLLLPEAIQVDHWNHNGLDNRRDNLRAATGSQNAANTRKPAGSLSKFKGVWPTRFGTFEAVLSVKNAENKRMCLGTFPTEEEAARAYDAAAREYFGEFANPNFPLAA